MGDDLVGLPALVVEPVRGVRRRRARPAPPLSGSRAGPKTTARARRCAGCGTSAARARDARYRPWVERFVAGDLPPAFGGDPRERWWRLDPAADEAGRRRAARASANPSADDDRIGRELRSFLDRLSREIGQLREDEPGAARINDLGRDDLVRLLDDGRRAGRRARRRWPMTCWRAGPTAAWITCSPPCPARARCAGSRVGSSLATWSGTRNKGRCAASTPRPDARRAARARQPGGLRRLRRSRAAGGDRRGDVPDVRGVHGRGAASPRVGLLRARRVDRPRAATSTPTRRRCPHATEAGSRSARFAAGRT